MLDVSGPAYLDNEAFEYKRLGADIVIDAAEAEGEPGEAEDAAAAEAESETLDDTAATDAKQDDVAEDKGDVK